MNVAIDIGNTATKIGLFKNDELVDRLTIKTGQINPLKEYCQKWQVKNGIISHSGKPFFEKSELGVDGKVIWLDHETPIPIENKYKTPKTLGKDRLAAVVGAYALFPKKHCFVVDAGTCVTYDFITKKRVYIGGNIAPGLEMRYRAMNEYTFALPRVDKPDATMADQFLGNDTKSALQLGGAMGLVNEMEGYRRELKKTFGKINIILTGGDAEYLASKFKRKIFVCPDLVLLGLIKILGYQSQIYE